MRYFPNMTFCEHQHHIRSNYSTFLPPSLPPSLSLSHYPSSLPSPQMMLLQERDLLPLSSQRIATIFLLYEPYRSDSLSSNPFSAFFAELLQVCRLQVQGFKSTTLDFYPGLFAAMEKKTGYKKAMRGGLGMSLPQPTFFAMLLCTYADLQDPRHGNLLHMSNKACTSYTI